MRTLFSIILVTCCISLCMAQNTPSGVLYSAHIDPSQHGFTDNNYYLRNEEDADSILLSHLFQVNSVQELMTILPDFADSTYYWNWDDNSAEWIVERKTIGFPNEEENYIITLGYDWNGTDWEKSTRVTTYYKDPGGLSRQVYENWDGTEFVNSSQSLFDYDPVKNERLATYQDWENNQWENKSNNRSSYNDQNKITHYIFKNWVAPYWVNQREVYNFYDTSSRVQEIQTYDWIGQWQLSHDQFYTYDSNQLTILNYLWEDTAGLILSSIYIAEYDSSGHPLSSVLTSYMNGVWRYTLRSFQEYNEFGNQVFSLSQRFSNQDTWENDRQTFQGYDSLQQRIYYKFQTWDSAWINTDSIHYYRSSLLTGTKSMPKNNLSLQVFPNPSNGIITFNWPTMPDGPVQLKIYSNTGVPVFEKQIPDGSSKQMDISFLAPGMYYIKIIRENTYALQRFVKL